MPDEPADQLDPNKDHRGNSSDDSNEVALAPDAPSRKPSTQFQFNQQVNVGQLPPRIWEALSPSQSVDLSEKLLDHHDKLDERKFKFAMEYQRREHDSRKRSTIIGGALAAVGLSGSIYLAANEMELLSGVLITFLATIIAVAVGNKFLK